MQAFESYEAAVRPARERFARSPAVVEVLSPDVDPHLLESFLIHFCALGVGVTEPVEGWIRRAGEACVARGLDDLGRALVRHARDEAGHDRLFEADARLLAGRWNAAGRAPLDADRLLALPPGPGAIRYRRLHEENIGGDTPYAQLAIEYEIEQLALSFGKDLLRTCVTVLGREVLAGLSFLREHVELDVGHTHFNRRRMATLLHEHPEVAGALQRAGTEVLDAYAAFLSDCLEAARPALAPVR
jgi:hypothetical protein